MSMSVLPTGAELKLGLAERSNRVRLEIHGPDRAKFLHNLTTNDIKRLPVGRGCEAFVTSPQGKTLAYVVVLAAEDKLVVRADPGGLVLALPHLRKYGVFDDVTIDDISPETFEFHVAGADASELLSRLAGPTPDGAAYAHWAADVAGVSIRAVAESPLGAPGFTLIGPAAGGVLVRSRIEELAAATGLDLIELDRDSLDAMRIAAGTPEFGRDITDKNLPQEIGRDSQAINFVKGCYLGQETVARLDALGHVNQMLRTLRFADGAVRPEPGWELRDGEKRVGVITSSALSGASVSPVALAMVRATHFGAGTLLKYGPPGSEAVGTATVGEVLK
jgi:folate-binding protein YgfZ